MSEGGEDRPDEATVADVSLELSRRSSLSRDIPIIPGYDMKEVLGSGAFGTVYKAVQQSTGQTVAVKVLFSVSSGFREEVEKLSRVSDHPNIVTLVDANLSFDPPYLVTPFLPDSLQAQLPSSPEEADIPAIIGWFEQIARVLQFVHGRGILHCDLKPANILLGEDGQPRLVDFGQSVSLEEGEMRLGSFWYMPLQQARLPGEGSEVPQVGWDLHALGATIYVLLTGRLPRTTEDSKQYLSELKTSEEKVDTYRRVLKQNRLQPIKELNSQVDSELASIVEACLKQDGEPVYTSAAEVVQDLERRKARLPLKARKHTFPYWLKLFFARHRVSVLIGLLAATVLLSGFSLATYQVYQARVARQAVIAQQFRMGQSLLKKGKASGLVWLARVCEEEPNAERIEALKIGLSRQLSIASAKLYRLPTYTAPSPSGTRAIWVKRDENQSRVLIDLTNGATQPIPSEILALNQDQKDTIRYRMDGVVLHPTEGKGGPATWTLPQFQAISPAGVNMSVAIYVGEDSVLQVKRRGKGYVVVDSEGESVFQLEGKGHILSTPAFSYQGDLAVGWDDRRVVMYSRDKAWAARTLDDNFYTNQFCFSLDGKKIAGHDGVSKVRVWDASGKELGEFDVGESVNEMTFGTEGRLLVISTRDASIYGFDLTTGEAAFAPAEMEKSARWVYLQPGGRVVTMSDEVTVWNQPSREGILPSDVASLTREVARRTGWIFDETGRVRTLTRQEYQALYQ